MSILRDFEKRLEGAVEGFFARAFRSGLQPVELAKALQRYAANYQQVGLDGVVVPNVYRFVLSRDDMQRFSGFADSLRTELAQVVSRTAGDRGWRLAGDPRVDLVTGEQVRTGTYELRGKVESPEAERAPEQPRHDPRPEQADATRVMGGGGGDGRAVVIDADGRRHGVGRAAVIGRLPECDVTLDDPAVSRRHARITSDDGEYRIEDLGSTNGVRVNGETVTTARLRDGDRVDLGGVKVTFSLAT